MQAMTYMYMTNEGSAAKYISMKLPRGKPHYRKKTA